MNVQQIPNYVFPRGSRDELGQAMANRFKEMLLNGKPSRKQDGLITRPKFINRKGAGGGRDETLLIAPEVRFPDDGPGSIPHVLLVGIQADDGFQDYGDDQWIVRCTISLDCRANGAMPQGASKGFDAKKADAILGDFVWSMLDNSDVMNEWGFTWPQTKKEQPNGGAFLRDGTPVQYNYPLLCTYEAYVWRVENP